MTDLEAYADYLQKEYKASQKSILQKKNLNPRLQKELTQIVKTEENLFLQYYQNIKSKLETAQSYLDYVRVNGNFSHAKKEKKERLSQLVTNTKKASQIADIAEKNTIYFYTKGPSHSFSYQPHSSYRKRHKDFLA